MRLLQVVTSYQSIVTILSTKLEMLGRQNELCVASANDTPLEERPCPGSFFQVDIPRTIRPLSDLKAAIQLVRVIRKFKPDIVHTHTAKAGVVGAVAGRFTGVPVVHTYHGLPWFSGQSRLANLLYKCIEHCCSRWRTLVFSQNAEDFYELKESFPCPVLYEGNGVDVPEIERNAADHADEVRGIWPPGNVRIVCVARLEPVKRVETILLCLKHLTDEGLEPSLVIAGRGPLEGKLRAMAQSLALQDRLSITYTPFVHALISLADIAVLSSVKEGIPRGLMEAMALGKPVVATNVLGTKELVAHGRTGFLVPFGDQEAFDGATRTLVVNPVLRAQFGRAGRQRILERFSEHKIVELWRREYHRILGQRDTSDEGEQA